MCKLKICFISSWINVKININPRVIFIAGQRKLAPERKVFINSWPEHYQPNDVKDVQEMLEYSCFRVHAVRAQKTANPALETVIIKT